MSDHKPDVTGRAEYDDEVLDAGWVPPLEAIAPEPDVHPPVPSRTVGTDADAFLEVVYRSQGSDIE